MKMLNSVRGAVLFLSFAQFFSACGSGLGEPKVPYYIESYNMDGTKLIVNGSSNQNDPGTYSQTQYTIKSGQRLLVRFENLSRHVDSIKNSWDNELHLRIVPTQGTDAGTLKNFLKLCPLTKNWMMLATWYKAHPFNKQGVWFNPGGDFDSGSCIKGQVEMPDGTNPDASPSPSPSPGVDGNLLARPKPSPSFYRHTGENNRGGHIPGTYSGKDEAVIDLPSVIFDIKLWFQSNPEGRSVNYGFILISENPVTIFGDKSDSYSPRIYWKKPKAYYTIGRRGGGGEF